MKILGELAVAVLVVLVTVVAAVETGIVGYIAVYLALTLWSQGIPPCGGR